VRFTRDAQAKDTDARKLTKVRPQQPPPPPRGPLGSAHRGEEQKSGARASVSAGGCTQLEELSPAFASTSSPRIQDGGEDFAYSSECVKDEDEDENDRPLARIRLVGPDFTVHCGIRLDGLLLAQARPAKGGLTHAGLEPDPSVCS